MAARRTLAAKVSAEGVTLHSGVPARLTLHSAPPATGIVFRRTDIAGAAAIPALWSNVSETKRGTVLKGVDGASIGLVEHLLAALSGAQIDDCLADVDGPEPPALDGDALSFLNLIDGAGVREENAPRRALAVRKPVAAAMASSRAALLPAARFELDCSIDFAAKAIGRQSYSFVFAPFTFRHEIAPARTFGFLEEWEQLRAAGLGRGASLTNTLVIDKDTLINPELQRFPDEFVRHKILDAIGDLALIGAPLIARYEGLRPSHALNNALLAALFADVSNYDMVTI